MAVTAAPALAAAAAHRSFLAFDFGALRVGVAHGNTVTRTAQPLGTIAATGIQRFERIQKFIAQWQPDALVIGVPFHPDGAAHDNTERARRFGRQLQGRFGLSVIEVDERYSTTEAHSFGAGDVDADIDAISAAIILEQHLRGLP